MAEEQETLNNTEFTGVAPDDMVKAVFTGDRRMKDLAIKPEAIDPDDPDMLSDVILAAVNDAWHKWTKLRKTLWASILRA